MNERRRIDLDAALAERLKEVRRNEPRQDAARFLQARETVVTRARRRTIIRFGAAALSAVGITLAVMTLPPPATYKSVYQAPRNEMAATAPGSGTADPWVIASSRRASLEGDGWVPRSWGPRT